MLFRSDGKSQGFSETVPAQQASLQGYKLSSCILDEIHTYSDHKLYTAAIKGTSGKVNPMIMMISTAGEESKTFCKERIEYAKKVLKKEVEDDSFVAILLARSHSREAGDSGRNGGILSLREREPRLVA